MENATSIPKLVSTVAAAEHAKDSVDVADISTALWQPLRHEDSIRLFHLSRDLSTGLLRFSLFEHRLSDHPAYIALSYAWGQAGNVSIIENAYGPRALRRNLFAFLNTLHNWLVRGELPINTLFWVDALCINQESAEEKAQQVQQIGSTFEQAKRVLIWLGTHQDNKGGCLDAVAGRSTFAAWKRFNSHVYWTRVWIIQEVVLANDPLLMDESYSVPIGRLWSRVDAPFPRGVIVIRAMYHKGEDSRAKHCTDLMRWFKDHECTDPRDKVYALRSLSLPVFRVVVDYTISIGFLFWRVLYQEGSHAGMYPTKFLMQALGLSCENLYPVRAAESSLITTSETVPKGVTSSEWEQLNHERTKISLLVFGRSNVHGEYLARFQSADEVSHKTVSNYSLISGEIGEGDLVIFFNNTRICLALTKANLGVSDESQTRSFRVSGVFAVDPRLKADRRPGFFFYSILQQAIDIWFSIAGNPARCELPTTAYRCLVLMHIALSLSEPQR